MLLYNILYIIVNKQKTNKQTKANNSFIPHINFLYFQVKDKMTKSEKQNKQK